MSGAEYTEDFSQVAAAEHEWIRDRRRATGVVADDAPLAGLALSGGGIRSAAFNLGVLQSLARHGMLDRFDYLSTVSGGGYIGSCLTWLRAHVPAGSLQRLGDIPLASGTGTVLDWLRAHGRYLIAGKGLSGWTLAASILAGTLLNLVVLVPLLLLAIGLASGDWFEFSWPPHLALPGAGSVGAHDGFMMLALLGVGLFAFYLLATLAFALSTVFPPLRQLSAGQNIRQGLGKLLGGAVICVGVGLLPVLSQLEETALHFLESQSAALVTRHATWIAPLLGGLISMAQARKRGMHSGTLAVTGLALVMFGLFTLLYHVAHHTTLLVSPAFLGWVALSLMLAMVCDINAVSMHSYYRSQLGEAFLPEVGTPQGESPRHPLLFRLAEVSAASGGPLHLINTTLNTMSSTDARLRARYGDNLVLSPLYCGSTSTGFRRTAQYLKGALTLSTAFAVSGAAIDPGTQATSSRPMSFLMALLNVRLGVWLPNPRHEPRRLRWPAWYQLLLREMLGVGLDEKRARVHLSDGGHFENLGVYELLRRRCRFILVSDAGADPDTTLADLAQAVQRARADFGADVELCADSLLRDEGAGLPKRTWLAGRVTYADGSRGEIIYLKALMRAGLSADVFGYWRTNPQFPDQPTSNQFYGEMQFDSYRELGRQLVNGLVDECADLESVFLRAREA